MATFLLHSQNDSVIPIDESLALVPEGGKRAATLIVVGLDHNMVDDEALDALMGVLKEIDRLKGTGV